MAPILSQAVKEIGSGNAHEVVGLFEMFPITLMASSVLSLPTLLLYLFVYHLAESSKMKTTWVKLILVLWVIIGISLTLYLFDIELILHIGSYYIIADTICGILLKMKRISPETVEV